MRTFSIGVFVLVPLFGCAGCLGSSISPNGSGAMDGTGGVGGAGGTGGSGGGASIADGGANPGDAATPSDGGMPSDDGGAPLVPAPLTGTVTAGTWQYGDLPFNGIATGKFHYAYLLPSGYSTAYRYPILVYEHENTEGNSWYQSGGDPTQNTIVNQDVIDGVFNSVAFRTAYPAIVIVPFCDQTDGSAGSSGQNFGGYNDVPGQNANENAVVAVVQSFLAHQSAYPDKVYITGDSLGGIGAIATMLDYNAYNGPIAKVFTAGLPYAGQIALRTPNPATDSATISRMASVPMWCVSGAGDGTSPPEAFNRPLWRALAGNSSYPSATDADGSRAGTTQLHYTEDPGLGHNVWSQNGGRQYRLLPDGAPMYDWLFGQTSH
jgi:predicted peptidase